MNARFHTDLGREPLGASLLRVLTPRIVVSPQLRQLLAPLHGDVSPARRVELVEAVSQYLWACLGPGALDVARELDRVTDGALGFSPRDEVVAVDREDGVIEARRAAGLLGAKLGFGAVKRMKLATAVSELARNVVMYAGRGEVRLAAVLPPRAAVRVDAVDRGPGIADLEAVLAGTYRSRSGLGLGLRGVQNVADAFEVRTAAGQGTHVYAFFEVQRAAATGRDGGPLNPRTGGMWR